MTDLNQVLRGDLRYQRHLHGADRFGICALLGYQAGHPRLSPGTTSKLVTLEFFHGGAVSRGYGITSPPNRGGWQIPVEEISMEDTPDKVK